MAIPVTLTNLVPVLLPCLILLALYGRIRRNIRRQVFKSRRITLRLIFFSVFILLIAALSLNYPSSLAGFGVGILLGVPLGLAGLHLTRFETTAEGRFFTPNMYIGVALSFLLVGRLAYRLTLLYAASLDVSQHVPGLLQSPMTLLIFGIIAGYYTFYNTSLLVQSRRMSREKGEA